MAPSKHWAGDMTAGVCCISIRQRAPRKPPGSAGNNGTVNTHGFGNRARPFCRKSFISIPLRYTVYDNAAAFYILFLQQRLCNRASIVMKRCHFRTRAQTHSQSTPFPAGKKGHAFSSVPLFYPSVPCPFRHYVCIHMAKPSSR